MPMLAVVRQAQRAMRRVAGIAAAAAACGCGAPPTETPSPVAAVGAAVEQSVDFTPRPYVEIAHPDWSRDATIYQLNTRQFTPEGTFLAAAEQLPRLQALGVRIIYLMPIHPIGEVNRKGGLGSPYSIKDYLGVNPEFGTFEDFRAFVDAAHALGLYVILDLVANHSAWDNPLTQTHPEWYERNADGTLRPTPWVDWSDIVDLNYEDPGLRRYRTEAMAFWVREADVDGFRCDVAGFVPLDFWETVRRELDAIKPVFMLAEWDSRDVHRKAFDASYAWGWKDALEPIARLETDASAMVGFLYHEDSFPPGAMRLIFTSNHDLNAWDGSAPERFGPALEAALVLSFATRGIPLIYNGQEAGLEKRLAFFEKDPIAWRPHPHADLLRRLVALKKEEPSLWNADWGAPMTPIENSNPGQVLSFARGDGPEAVIAIFNLSATPATARLSLGSLAGPYKDFADDATYMALPEIEVMLPPWGYRVLRANG